MEDSDDLLLVEHCALRGVCPKLDLYMDVAMIVGGIAVALILYC